ncbi:MAG: prenyltransferase [Myxococcota bacterium]
MTAGNNPLRTPSQKSRQGGADLPEVASARGRVHESRAGSASVRPGSIRAWIQAFRPLAHANLFAPLLVGEMLAFSQTGRFDLLAFLLVHLFGLFDQAYIVFANDLTDVDADRPNETFNRFSGGSRVLVEGLLTKSELRLGVLVSLVLLFACSACLAWRTENATCLVAFAAAVGLLYAYSVPPFRLSYRGYGELLQGLGIGVVLPLLGYVAHAATLERFPFWFLGVTFLLGYAGNILTALPDAPSDALAEKRTWPVRNGVQSARSNSLLLMSGAAIWGFLATPGLTLSWRLAIAVPPLLLLLGSLAWVDSAQATDKRACFCFILLSGAAMQVQLLFTSAALYLSPSFVP